MSNKLKQILHQIERTFQFSSFRGHSFWNFPLNQQSLMIDLGANRCDFSAEFKKTFDCKILSVEPNPDLKPNNPEFCNSVDNIAITGSEGDFEFTISDNPEASSLRSDLASVFGKAKTIKVKGMTLKQYLNFKNININVSVLKIDIEGGEIELLSKITGEELNLIDQMTVEFHSFLDPSLEDHIRSIIKRIKKSGFWVVNCNYPYYDDVLFINEKMLKVYGLRCINIFAMKFVYIMRGYIHKLIGTNKLYKSISHPN